MNYQELFAGKKVLSTGGVEPSIIEQAEKELNFKMPKDYKELLMSYGAISIGSHEIAALGVEGYLNVVTLTNQERLRANGGLDNYLVLENLATEGLLIVLDDSGAVYEYRNDSAERLFTDLKSYLKEEVL
jgi:hypothetical protein